MSMQSEIYHDITENCDIMLDLLKPFEAENDTPEGRMIYQCRWLKEQVKANKLPLPTQDYIHTLRYVTTEQLLHHMASSESDYNKEIGIYLYRLVKLVKKKPLLKPAYYSHTLQMMDVLSNTLTNATRPLSEYEQGLIGELKQLKQLLMEGKIEPPLMSYLPDYPAFRKVYSMTGSSIDDLPNGKIICKTVANLLFEGIRPDSWLTPEDVEREVKKFK